MSKETKKIRKNLNSQSDSPSQLKPIEALKFLENIRKMQSQIDEKTVAISIRIPGNLLKTLKLRAKANNQKYQSLIIQYIRSGLIK